MANRRTPSTAVYRRRRLAALLGALALALVFFAALRGGGSDGSAPTADTPEEQVRVEREAEPVELTISASGDLLIHSPVWFAAAANTSDGSYDFAPMLDPIRPYVEQADLALCHVETVIGFGEPQGFPLFSAPAELAPAIKKTGWDACDTASNHSVDHGQDGVDTTLKLLDEQKIEHTGSFATKGASRKPLLLSEKGVKVAVLGYTTDTNGIPPPNPWSVNVYERERVLADARAAREAGAEVVVVNIAWGSELVPEYVSEPGPGQEKEAEALAEAPEISAVVGNGPHVIQPIRFHKGTPIVYSNGNLLSNQTASCCAAASQDGLIALLDIVVDGDGDRVKRVRYVPTYVSRPDFTVLPVGEAIKDGSADATELQASWDRTVDVVGKSAKVKPIPKP